ncbi:MAG: copper chaperone PCu(A)C [Desulfurococcales archaeon]|nr:copper chaperone PCu(A)C [Desulfurococcales archaeon]
MVDGKMVRIVLVAVVVVLVLYLFVRPPIAVSEATYSSTGKSSAVYFEVKNWGLGKACIVDAEIEGIDAPVHLHRSVHVGGKMVMEMVDEVCVSPLSSIEFKRGGLHVMVMSGESLDGRTVVLKLSDGRVLETVIVGSVG